MSSGPLAMNYDRYKCTSCGVSVYAFPFFVFIDKVADINNGKPFCQECLLASYGNVSLLESYIATKSCKDCERTSRTYDMQVYKTTTTRFDDKVFYGDTYVATTAFCKKCDWLILKKC